MVTVVFEVVYLQRKLPAYEKRKLPAYEKKVVFEENVCYNERECVEILKCFCR